MSTPAVRVGCLGEVMLELVLGEGTDARLGIAGDTFNTAVYMAHQQPEGAVDYITGLGTDDFSARIRKYMAAYGLGASRVFTHPTRGPGLYAIETDGNGERSFTYWRDTAAARCLGDAGLPAIHDLLDGLTHLYYSGISLAILAPENRDKLFDAVDSFRAQGGVVAFDSNYRPRLWDDAKVARAQTARAWSKCDIAMPSLDDEMALFDEPTEAQVLGRFSSYNIPVGVLKRAAAGPVSLAGKRIESLATPKAVVDTTAAGDSFNAAYLSALIDGQDHAAAMEAGHALACRVVEQKGAIILNKETAA